MLFKHMKWRKFCKEDKNFLRLNKQLDDYVKWQDANFAKWVHLRSMKKLATHVPTIVRYENEISELETIMEKVKQKIIQKEQEIIKYCDNAGFKNMSI